MGLVRLLLISALAATLIGCSSAFQQTHQSFANRALYQAHQEQAPQMQSTRRVLPGRTVAAKSQHRKNNGSTKIAEPHNAPKMNASSSVRPDDKSNILTTTPTVPTKTEIPRPSQLHDEAKKTEISPSSQFNDETKKTERPQSPQLNDEAKKTEISPSSQLNKEAKKTEISPSSKLDDESVIKKAKATIAAKMSDPNSAEFEKVERAVSKNALGNSIDTICGYVSDKNNGSKLFLYIVQKDEAYIGAYAIATTEYRNVCSITTLGR